MTLTQLANFKADFKNLLDDLSAPYADGDKKGRKPDIIVANIPDVTSIPLLLPLGAKVGAIPFEFKINSDAATDEIRATVTKKNIENLMLSRTEVGEAEHPAGTMVSSFAVLTNDGLQAALRDGKMVFADGDVLTPTELETIATRVADFNTEIAALVAERDNVALFDANTKFKQIKADGLMIGGTPLDASLSGGLFSWDGIHPTKTGYAVLANEFIKAMNAKLAEHNFGGFAKGTVHGLIDLAKVLAADPQKPT